MMDREEHVEALKEWLEPAPPSNPVSERNLNEALYALSETGVFGDLSVDADLARKIWGAVEAVRTRGFPKELRM